MLGNRQLADAEPGPDAFAERDAVNTMALLIGTNVFIIILLGVSVGVSYLGLRKGNESADKLDGRLSELIAETRTSAHAAGAQEERNRDKTGD